MKTQQFTILSKFIIYTIILTPIDLMFGVLMFEVLL